MDLNMPIMDGFKATKKIKEHFNSNNLFFGSGIFAEDEAKSARLKQEPVIVALSSSELDEKLIL